MGNHFHHAIQVSAVKLGAIMQRIMTGHALTFNRRNDRTGHLFQARHDACLCLTERYLANLIRYIHLNPLSLIAPKWKEEGIADWAQAEEFLRAYAFSSYREYAGAEEARPETGLLLEMLGGAAGYQAFMRGWKPGKEVGLSKRSDLGHSKRSDLGLLKG
jgi:hypothetical protein